MSTLISQKPAGVRPSHILLVTSSNTTDALFQAETLSTNKTIFIVGSLREAISKVTLERTKFVFIDETVLALEAHLVEQFFDLLKRNDEIKVTILEGTDSPSIESGFVKMGFGYARKPFSVSQIEKLCSLR